MTNSPPPPAPRNGLLFLCAGNRARSQMAEAFARFIGPSGYSYYSASHSPAATLDPLAVKAMREVGIDISQQRPKGLDEVPLHQLTTVISLCAQEGRPALPAQVQFLAWPIADPSLEIEEEEEPIQSFRRARELVRELVSRLF